MRRYIAERRRRVDSFVDRHFTMRGAWRLNRAALGWDLLRAPINLAAAVPQIALALAGRGLGRLGAGAWGRRLCEQRLFLKTAVAREIEWLLYTDLLELPCSDGGRTAQRDALAEEILSDPRIEALIWAEGGTPDLRTVDPAFRERLVERLETYTGTRFAAADIATGLLTLGAGGVLFKQMTPGAISMGPLVAGAVAQHAAIASFPLGATAGGLWYGLFPTTASTGLVLGATGATMATAALLAAFAGIVTDPLQRRLGLHRRRLHRLLDVLEADLSGTGNKRFVVRDHYVARLLDTLDLLRSVARTAF